MHASPSSTTNQRFSRILSRFREPFREITTPSSSSFHEFNGLDLGPSVALAAEGDLNGYVETDDCDADRDRRVDRGSRFRKVPSNSGSHWAGGRFPATPRSRHNRRRRTGGMA